MRYFLVLAFLIGGALGGGLVYRNLTAGPPVVLSAPASLRVSDGAISLQPGGWTNARTLQFQAGKPATSMGMDLEVRPSGHPFVGKPTNVVQSPGQVASACTGCTASIPTVRVTLRDGTYHWQARLHNGQGISPWVKYRGTINVDTAPPVVQTLTSPTDPNPKLVYHSSAMRFDWSGADSGSGVSGYSYRLDTNPNGEALADVRTSAPTVLLQGLNTGQYYFHVRALDRAGNWGKTVTMPVHVDVTPPGLAHVSFSRFDFDPMYAQLGVSFGVTKAAGTVRVGFYKQSDGSLARLYVLHDVRPGTLKTVNWDGKGPLGHYVASGQYAVYIRAIDRYGHSSLAGWRDFSLEYKRIVVSLSEQKLWAYDGNHLVLSTLVTTGNRALPTPTGTYEVMAKFHPFTFHSPWPKSSPYYYAPSPVNWAMLFKAGGYFIHDAPWRSAYGPGTNAQLGTPGTNYTGSHGCVNVPENIMQQLYAWTTDGTAVVVQQ